MSRVDSYSPISLFAAICGIVASTTLNSKFSPDVASVTGTFITGLVGGIQLKEEEKTVKEKIHYSMEMVWEKIRIDYRLTDNCFNELKSEVMGESTSVESFLSNANRNNLESSLSIIINQILIKHVNELNKDPLIIWDNDYLKNASQNIATMIVKTIKSIPQSDDDLKIMLMLSKHREYEIKEHSDIKNTVIETGNRVIKELKTTEELAPLSLAAPPIPVALIGRDQDVISIQKVTSDKKKVVVVADGGVGKTAIASRIINDIKRLIVEGKSTFTHIAWINSSGSLKTDLSKLYIPNKHSESNDDQYLATCAFLQKNPTFLVIDNMDIPYSNQEMEDLNNIAGTTTILITSRAPIEGFFPYNLNSLDKDSAHLLFYSHFLKKNMAELSIEVIKNREDYKYALHIVAASDKNALIIELISKMAYADHKKLSILWPQLKDNVFFADSKTSISTSHGKKYGSQKLTVEEQIRRLYELSNLTVGMRALMSFMCIFPSQHCVFFDVFTWAGFEDNGTDDFLFLENHGWIERSDNGYLLHSVVKGSVEMQMKKDGITIDIYKYDKLLEELSKTQKYLPSTLLYSEIQERLTVAESVLKLCVSRDYFNVDVFNLGINIAKEHFERGYLKKTINLLFELICLCDRTRESGSISEFFTHILLLLYVSLLSGSTILSNPNNYIDSLVVRTIDDFKNNHYIAKLLSKIPHYISSIQQQLIESKQEIESKSQELQNQIEYLLDDDDPEDEEIPPIEKALFNNYMGNAYLSLGKYSKAISCFQYAIAVWKRVISMGDNIVSEYDSSLEQQLDITIVNCYIGIGDSYRGSGDYPKAIDNYQKGLSLIGSKAKYVETIICISFKIAEAYSQKGDISSSIATYNETIFFIRNLGMDYGVHLYEAYSNCANQYYKQKEYDDALRMYKKALKISKKVFGADSYKVLTIYMEMANTFHKIDDYPQEIRAYNIILSILHKSKSMDYRLLFDTHQKLSLVHSLNGDEQAAHKHHNYCRHYFKKYKREQKKSTKVMKPIIDYSINVVTQLFKTDDNSDNSITITDIDGNEITCEYQDLIIYDDKIYLVLMSSLDSCYAEKDQIMIFKVDENGELEQISFEDKEYENVLLIFKKNKDASSED